MSTLAAGSNRVLAVTGPAGGSPVLADLVDEDDVVRLPDSQLGAIRGERQALHHVALLAVLPAQR